ncbi:MAG: hypothetical protein ACFFAN_05340 [Promethearchaeota archaeon]
MSYKENKNFDPLEYFVKILKLMTLTWKFKWKRRWYRKKLNDNEKGILKIFGRNKGKKYVKICKENSFEEKFIVFYGLINLIFLFWSHFFMFFRKAVKKLFRNKDYPYPSEGEINPFKKQNKCWFKIKNIENQYNETIDFLYRERKYLENKTFKVCNKKEKEKIDKIVKFNPEDTNLINRKYDIIKIILNRIVPKAPQRPFQKNVWTFFFSANIVWFFILIFILPNYFFPEYSVYSGIPIIFELIWSQIPIMVFYILILLLFLKYEKLINFTQDNYDNQLNSNKDDIELSFKMRCDMRLISHNTGGLALAFLIGLLLYSVPVFVYLLIVETNWEFTTAWLFFVDIFVISDVFILWAINCGIWVIALYIVGGIAYGQYHISKEFKFKFDRFQSTNIDNMLRKYIRTICFYVFTTLFLALSSGFIYFLSHPFNLLVIIILVVSLFIIVISLFLISLVGWKRALVDQKKNVLEDIKERRDRLLNSLKTKEKMPNFETHSFKDLAELKFLDENYLEIYNLKEWVVDFTILYSFLITLFTFLPELLTLLSIFLKM